MMTVFNHIAALRGFGPGDPRTNNGVDVRGQIPKTAGIRPYIWSAMNHVAAAVARAVTKARLGPPESGVSTVQLPISVRALGGVDGVLTSARQRRIGVIAVPTAPGAAGVRVWHVTSRCAPADGRHPGRGPPQTPFMPAMLCAIHSTFVSFTGLMPHAPRRVEIRSDPRRCRRCL